LTVFKEETKILVSHFDSDYGIIGTFVNT
jgi:hypothetical protein